MAGQEARDARDAGIATAEAHADRINPTWRDLAYAELVAYAQRTPVFTIEQLRGSLNGRLENPPSLRAWGGIAQRAVRAGVIVHHGWREAENPACHCGEVRVWRSTKFVAGLPFKLVDTAPSAEFGDTVNAGVSLAFVRDLEDRLAVAETALRHVYQNLLLIAPGALWRVQHQSVYAACRDGIARVAKVPSDVVQDVAEEAALQRRYERDVVPPPGEAWLPPERPKALELIVSTAQYGEIRRALVGGANA